MEKPESLFDSREVMQEYVQREEFEIRPLEWPDDFDKGVCGVLDQLTTCSTPRSTFHKVFGQMQARGDTFVVVAHRRSDDAILGCGTVLLEPKFVHGGCSCAHIEDIVVTAAARGQHVGQAIIECLVAIARHAKAYKVILNCSDNNVGFYEKCGFSRREVEMALYF